MERQLALIAALLAFPVTASAQLDPKALLQLSESYAAKTAPPNQSVGGELGFGQVSEDFFVILNARFNFDTDKWGVGVQVPLRIRVIDNTPPNDDDLGRLIRKEDWDEFSDFFKIIRYAYVGQRDKKGPFYVRVGELSGLTVGHGTIVHRYFNGLDVNTFRFGTNVAVNIGAFGGEAVLADVGRIDDPVLAGLRFTARPLELIMGEGLIWERLVFGTTLMVDPQAPFEMQLDGDGNLALNKEGTPIATADRALYVFGVDVGIEIFKNSLIRIEPYIDFNQMNVVEGGSGLHMGVLWGVTVPAIIDTLTVDLRTEYRRVSGDYIGPYFDTIYEIDRRTKVGTTTDLARSPKLRLLTDGNSGGRNGVFFDLLAGLPEWIYVGGEFIDYDGGIDDGTLRLSLHVPALEIFQFSAFYYRTGISGLDDLFKLDTKSSLVAEARIPLYAFLTLNARWWRIWQSNGESVDDWSVGAGFNFTL